MLLQYFCSLYSVESENAASFTTFDDFPKLDDMDRRMLAKTFSLEDIKKALFSIGNLKSPGPGWVTTSNSSKEFGRAP